MSAIIDKITHQMYGWTMDHNPVGFSPSRKHWTLHPKLKRKFLTVNFRFKSDGTKVKIIA